jgi:hypothetical protein
MFDYACMTAVVSKGFCRGGSDRLSKMRENGKTEVACIRCCSAFVVLKPRHLCAVSSACKSALCLKLSACWSTALLTHVTADEWALSVLAGMWVVRKHIRKIPDLSQWGSRLAKTGSLPEGMPPYKKGRTLDNEVVKPLTQRADALNLWQTFW